MAPLASRIARAGFDPVNLDYPSTCHAIETLVDEHVRPVVESASARGPVHFVTHSLGGILVRALAERHGLADGTRAVMLAPPNAGSEIADALRDRWPFTRFCGPALTELGTDGACVPPRLGPVTAEVGVIAGDRSLYPWFAPIFSGPNDGLVAVERTRVEGMADFAVVHAGHAFIMRNRTVAEQAVHFLRHGRFRNGEVG
jgi:pimeloyl-ACP methyl ester carboxylesterase